MKILAEKDRFRATMAAREKETSELEDIEPYSLPLNNKENICWSFKNQLSETSGKVEQKLKHPCSKKKKKLQKESSSSKLATVSSLYSKSHTPVDPSNWQPPEHQMLYILCLF